MAQPYEYAPQDNWVRCRWACGAEAPHIRALVHTPDCLGERSWREGAWQWPAPARLHRHDQYCFDLQGLLRCGRVAGVDDEPWTPRCRECDAVLPAGQACDCLTTPACPYCGRPGNGEPCAPYCGASGASVTPAG